VRNLQTAGGAGSWREDTRPGKKERGPYPKEKILLNGVETVLEDKVGGLAVKGQRWGNV